MRSYESNILPVVCAGFALSGACYAFAAGAHQAYSETAISTEIKNQEIDKRNNNLIAGGVMETVAIGGIVSLARNRQN